MKLSSLVEILDAIAPTRYAEGWDNVGLLAGDLNSEITKALLCVDLTESVFQEALIGGHQVVIAYHPPIFQPIKRLTDSELVFRAISRGVAIYSPHTALDVAEGGTNDVLAEIAGIRTAQALRPIPGGPWHYKLITFVPPEQAQGLAKALFDAGAGWIGNYSHCSFRSEGTGTFLGHEGTHPTVGRVGELENAQEIRLETIVPAKAIGPVVEALRRSHPYEEPAFDLVQLTSPPDGRGMGRFGAIIPTGRRELIETIRRGLGVERLLVAGPLDGMAGKVACLAGDGGSFVDDAISLGADVFLTGEIKHHAALKAARAGMTVVSALHSNSERITLPRYARRIAESAGIDAAISRQDRDPFAIL